MHRRFALLILLFLAGCGRPAATDSLPDAQQLVGTWKVDLRPTPGSEPYFQQLVVSQVSGKAFSGMFYGSPISEGRINTDWSAVRIAFTTEDRSGAYHHSAVLSEGTLEGLSNSSGRDFLAYWSATKEVDR